MMANEDHTRGRTDVDEGGTTRLVQVDIHADNEVLADKQHDSVNMENAANGSGKIAEGNSKAENNPDGEVDARDDDVRHMVEFDRTGVDGSGGRCSTASLMESLAYGFTAGVVIVLLLTICVLLASSLIFFEKERHDKVMAKLTRNETYGNLDIGTAQVVLYFICGVVDVIVLVACTSYVMMAMYCVSYGRSFVKLCRVSMPICALLYAFLGSYAIYCAVKELSVAGRLRKNAYFYQVVLGTGIICLVAAVDMLLVGISACIKFNQTNQGGYEQIEDSEQPLQQETGASTVEAVSCEQPDKSAILGASTDSKKSQASSSLTSSGRYQHQQLHPE